MATKIYTHEKVTYGAHGRRWVFEAPGYSYATPRMPMGADTAHKVARIINGAVKRLGSKISTVGLDGLARANRDTVFHNALKAQSRLALR
jgi:hypothetical protein